MATVTKKVMAAIETDARKNERLYKNNLMRLVAKIKKIVMEESDPADIVAVPLGRKCAEPSLFRWLAHE